MGYRAIPSNVRYRPTRLIEFDDLAGMMPNPGNDAAEDDPSSLDDLDDMDDSSLLSNNVCMPRQMPKYGLSLLRYSRNAASYPLARSTSMAEW